MVAEYKRSLKEAWYANKLFWILNLIIQVTIVSLLHAEYVQDYFMIITASLNIYTNLTMVILMFFNDKRTVRSRARFQVDEQSFLENQPNPPRLSEEEGLAIVVKFQEKSLWIGGKNFYQFRIQLKSIER